MPIKLLNSNKTEYIVFSSRLKSPGDLNIHLGGQKLNPSKTLKYLGVTIDEHLNWNSQISNICYKLRRANGALSRIRHFVNSSILLNIYHSLFGSHLRYGCQLWAQNENTATRRVFVLQKCAVRLISFSLPRSPSAPIFSSLKILTLFDLVKLLNILLIYQFLNSSLPLDLLSTLVFEKIAHVYPTRSQSLGLLKLPRVGTSTYGLKSLSYQAISQWNFFQVMISSDNLANLPLPTIKDIIKSYFLSQYTNHS